MHWTKNVFVLVLLLLAGCAQVPKESVELSVTVGRDIEQLHQAHANTITILYKRMREDVNRFIDDVYTPYAIKEAINKDRARLNSGGVSFIKMINAGLSKSASPYAQDDAIGAMRLLVTELHTSVERQRVSLLEPLNQQETVLLKSVNRSYLAVHQANSIVTGHLASVVKVHDAQNEILNEIGIQADIRSIMSEEIANASEEIAAIANASTNEFEKLGGSKGAADKLQAIVDKLNINN